uniref:Uncharacterized protein n=1 Tax=Anguilla anguilla TaxID=7936 RepID=A0A0E9RN02_ANGAN
MSCLLKCRLYVCECVLARMCVLVRVAHAALFVPVLFLFYRMDYL